MTIEERVAKQLAISRFLRAQTRFEEANKDYMDASQEVRKVLQNPERFLIKVDHQHYLVTSQQSGDFDIEQMETI